MCFKIQRIIIAHRGASAQAPENTLLAFKKAWQLGAQMIELDVHETVDGHLVCIHDPTIDRTTNGTGEVSSLTLKEIQEFDAGLGQRVPLLNEILEFARGKIQVNIELKTPGVEDKVASLLNEMTFIDTAMVSSFLHLSLSEIKEIDDKIRIAILLQQEIDDLSSYAHGLNAYAINPLFELVSETMVSSAHNRGIKVFPWTVNDEEQMMRLFNKGVDGLITDHPDKGVQVIRSINQ
ncbi:MAG: glycerophosphodiester phosphodiesterase family protein [Candidatus Thorarchaeota archaeon]